jgi:predicted MPP superfamily phosphohydrolase
MLKSMLQLLKSLPFVLLFCALPLVAAAEETVGGPAVVNVGPRTATVIWLVSDAQSTLGEAPDNQKVIAKTVQVRKTVYTGLKPGTTYYYTVPAGTGHFKTALARSPVNSPGAGSAQYSFVVFGDTRTRDDVHAQVIARVEKTDPDFVVHTGDLVAEGADTALWPNFFKIEKSLLAKAAFYPALGNHEKNDKQYYAFLDSPGPYYSFNWGNAHFSVLNTDIGSAALGTGAQDQYWKEQVAWLEQDLAKNQMADFRFVVGHHPPFTAVSDRQGDNAHVSALVPMMEKYKVTAMFNGHDHNYQRYEKKGINYVTTGGGGAPLYDVDMPPAYITRKVEKTENFVHVMVDGKHASMEAIAIDGRVIDRIDLGAPTTVSVSSR